MTEPFWEFPVRLPRHAFSPRDAVRAGDMWRCFQEVAVDASSHVGWPPERYRDAGTSFIVRAATVLHHREPTYGEGARARTWVSTFRRGIFCTREIRLTSARGALASGTQEWAHISADLKPMRADSSLTDCFPEHTDGPSMTLPEWEQDASELHGFPLRVWHTWMDPLAHVNHPVYVDWADESVSQVMAKAGLDPVALVPVAEKVSFKLGAVADEDVTVGTRRLGRTEDGFVAFGHEFRNAEGKLAASATTVRRMVEGNDDALAAAF